MKQEIRGVVAVRFAVQVGAHVFGRGAADDVADRGVFHQPVAAAGDRPVEEGAGGAAVAVGEGVVVADHEVQQDGAQHGMDEG